MNTIYGALDLLLLIGSSKIMSKNNTTFEWPATESAPRYCPIKIVLGEMFYAVVEA